MPNHFLKSQRLLTSTEFQALRGTRLTVSDANILLLAKKNDNNPRLGLTISKRNVKHAAARNRIKRLSRESFRHHATQLPNLDIVLLARPGAAQLTNSELRQCIDSLWPQLAKRAQSVV